jgi:hypothetical protein
VPADPPEEPTGTNRPADPPADPPGSGTPGDPPADPPGSGAPGGSSVDRESIAEVAESFYHGVAAKDGDRVCALMTAAAQRSAAGDSKDCATSLQEVELSTAEAAALSQVEVDPDGVQVTGDQAAVPASATSVNGRTSTETGDMKLVRLAGTWKIDDID